MGQGEEARCFSPRRQIGKHMAVDARSLDARPSLPRSLQVAKVPPLPPICGRQTHHLSLICFRIGSGEVTKEEGGTNGVKTSCGLTAPARKSR